MAYNKKYWMKQKEEEKKEWANKAIENIKLYQQKPEDVKEYLDFMSRMYNYSPRNIGMIKEQYPGAGFVASKEKYKELGFDILPDQKGIEILVPTPVKYFKDEKGKQKQVRYANESEKKLLDDKKLEQFQKTFFSLKPVYDVTQTNARPEDYPKIYPNGRMNFNVEDKDIVKDIFSASKKFLEEKGIPVTEENFSKHQIGAAKGYYVPQSNRIALNSLNTDTENMTVLIHETAHAMLHNDFKKNINTPTEIKELEAEMTSYVVNKHFGIDTSEFSTPYIASWTKNMTNVKDVETSLKNILDASGEIIEGIEKNLSNEKEYSLTKGDKIPFKIDKSDIQNFKIVAGESVDMSMEANDKPIYLDEKLKTIGKKAGISKEGNFKQPLIHVSESEQVMMLTPLSNSVKKGNYKLDSFDYEVFTRPGEPLFKGSFSKHNGKSLIEQLKVDADLNGVPDVFEKSLNDMKKNNKENSMDKNSGKKLELGN